MSNDDVMKSRKSNYWLKEYLWGRESDEFCYDLNSENYVKAVSYWRSKAKEKGMSVDMFLYETEAFRLHRLHAVHEMA